MLFHFIRKKVMFSRHLFCNKKVYVTEDFWYCLQFNEIKIKRQYKSVNVTKNHNLFFCCAKRTHLWCSNFAPIKWDATADIRGTQGGLLTVTGQSGQAWTTTPFRQFQKVRCRKISLNPLCLAAKVLDLKLMWNSKL